MATKKRLGELLLESGVIDESMLQSALGHQRRWGGRLGQALLDLKLVAEPVIVDALSRKVGIEVARLGGLEPYALEQAMKLVPREFAQRNNVFPMGADTSTITVAMSDPTNLALTDELQFRTGRRVKVCIAGDREITEAIRSHYPQEYQASTAIPLDVEGTGGDGLPLAEPFEGGSTEVMRAMLEPTRHTPARPAAQATAPATAPVPPPAPAPPTAPYLASASPVPSRPAIQPPAPPVASVVPALQPRAAPPAGAVSAPGRPGGPTQPAPRPVSTPAPAAAPRPALTRPIPTGVPAVAPAPFQGLPGRAVPPAPAAVAPAPTTPPLPSSAAAQAARDAMLGAIPRGGFAPGESYEELTPSPVDEADPISADLLAPEVELVEDRATGRELSPRDVAILDALDRLARGIEDPASPLKPARVAATLLRLLLKKKLIGEAELLDELSRR